MVALPALRLIRRSFPEAGITILTNTPVSGKAAPLEAVLEGSGLYQDTLHYPIGLRDPSALLELIRMIREKQFSVALHLTPHRGLAKTIRDYIFFKACGISRIIGLPWTDKLNQRGSPDTALYQHESKRLLQRTRSLGAMDLEDARSWDLGLTQPEIDAAENLLKSRGITKPYLAFSLGTKVDVNDWGIEKWKLLTARLNSANPGYAVIAIGARDEETRVTEVLDEWTGIRGNLCGLASPRVSAALLRRAQLFIGHDSGPMHLAAAVGTPCVAIFSARNLPGQWYPWGKKHTVIYHKVPCAGCALEICLERGKICMTSITVDEVFAAVMKHLALTPFSSSETKGAVLEL